MADQFKGIWDVTPWGKQLLLDFFGLEAILALPLFGSMSAAAYWLLR